jgi:hypothetical protein
VENRG